MEPDNYPERSDHVKEKGTKSSRGRSKKRVSSNKAKKKKTEPFGHIALGILPSAAIASASPNAVNHVRKNRSPSPIARAVAFAGRIGHIVAAGNRLGRSLSEQDLHRQSSSSGIAESKPLSKSNPGPYGFHEDLDDDDHYESVRDFTKGRLQIIDDSPMARRPPIPIPDAEDGKEKSHGIEDLYSKVVKHKTAENKIEKRATEPPDDSDDLTFVSEMDEDTPSRLFLKKAKLKQQDSEQDISEGPSDGEIYRLPFDAINNEAYSGIQIQTIEELDNEEFSSRSRPTGDVVSPGSGRSKGSSHESAGLPPLTRARSIQSVSSDQERMSSRPQTPRELGREAALRRLEELGFDAISKEFGMSLSSSHGSEHGFDHVDGSVERIIEKPVPVSLNADYSESCPSFDSKVSDPKVENFGRSRVSLLSQQFEPLKTSEGNLKRAIFVEEPIIGVTETAQEQSSQELLLEELVDESKSDDWLSKSEPVNPVMSSKSVAKGITSNEKSDDDATFPKYDHHPTELELNKAKKFEKEKPVNDIELQQLGELQKEKAPTRNSEASRGHINGMQHPIGKMLTPRDEVHDQKNATVDQIINEPNTASESMLIESSKALEEQKQMQLEMKHKQDKIIDTISELETQFQKVAHQLSPTQKEKADQEEKLSLLRILIKDEQKKYLQQQKVLEDHEKRIIEMQKMASPRRQIRSQSRFSNSPVSPREYQDETRVRRESPRKYHDEIRAKREFLEQPVQFSMLESRMKNVEAERQALLDLNSSLQDENDALKRLAYHQDNTDSSGVIFKKQNAELLESNKNLKSIVHRLNIELSRYQAKYRPPRKDEVEGLSLPEEGPVPEWLVNVKYLSPLVMAYDDRIKEKNEVIRAYESHLASFKSRMLEIVRENQKLHMMVNDKSKENDAIAFDEWNILQEQAKLVVEENAILMQEIDLKDRRIDELQDTHLSEISQLAKGLRILEHEKRNLKMQLTSSQIDTETWKQKYGNIAAELEKRVTEEEVNRRILSVERPLLLKIESFENEKDSSSSKLDAVLKEKQELAVRLTDANATVSRLQLEIDLANRASRKSERKLDIMQRKLDATKEKEAMATETLRQVLSVAEESSKERDVFAKLIEFQNKETRVSNNQKREYEKKIDKLRNQLQKCKELLTVKTNEMSKGISEKDDEILNLKNNYDREISNLRQIIRDRQKMLDYIQTDKSNFENDIDELWKSITEENIELRKSLPK